MNQDDEGRGHDTLGVDAVWAVLIVIFLVVCMIFFDKSREDAQVQARVDTCCRGMR